MINRGLCRDLKGFISSSKKFTNVAGAFPLPGRSMTSALNGASPALTVLGPV